MRKVCKIILIVLFYVFMFWGLVNGVKSVLHKTNKCNRNCDKTEKVIEVIKEVAIEETKVEVKEEKKEEPKEEKPKEQTKTVVNNNTQKTAPAVTGTKAEYQAYAHDLVLNQYLWSEADYQALVNLWTRESDWDADAHNRSSGAHGIPQSLPASKMSSEGSDYYTNGYTQIRWGLKYIKDRYGSPSAAWQHFQNKNWY